MFDISWTEFLLIGIIALIVIGPKELPGVMRTLGQWTRKMRVMANEFQNQFHEAMREAEMADLKKQVDDLAHDIKSYDPLKDVRSNVDAVGKDIQSSLAGTPKAEAAVAAAPAGTAAASTEAQTAVPAVPVERGDLEPAGADVVPAAPKPAAEAAPGDTAERSE
jgi:sec-independent protein translocase protein TatB